MEKLDLEIIEELIKNKKYETIKKYSYNFIRINKDKLHDRFNLACMLSEYPETIGLSKILLYSLINSYFRDFAVTKLISIYMDEGNFEEIKELIEYKFIGKQSSDELILLSKIEKNLGNYNQAYNYLEDVSNTENYDDLIYIYELVLLEMKMGNNEKAYRILTDNECLKYHDKYGFIYMYLSIKIKGYTSICSNRYYKKQLMGYSENLAKKFISQDRVTGNAKLIRSVDVNRLYSECKSCIQNIKPVFSDYMDRYIVELEYDVGILGENKTKYVLVSTFLNEKDIIGISPTNMHLKSQNVGSIRRNNEDDISILKYKRETQIEKFNRRYKIEN